VPQWHSAIAIFEILRVNLARPEAILNIEFERKNFPEEHWARTVADSPDDSREAAKECSPQRKPWAKK